MRPLPCPTGAAGQSEKRKNKLTLMCWRSSHCLVISDLQVFHCEILPRRRGATDRDPGGPQIKPQQLADGGRRGESQGSGRVGGELGLEMTREREELNTWKARSQQAPLANTPQMSTRSCRRAGSIIGRRSEQLSPTSR